MTRLTRSTSARALGVTAATLALSLAALPLSAQSGEPPRGVVAATGRQMARVTLSTEQVRALIAAHHPTIAIGSSADNNVSIILDSNGAYVTGGSSVIENVGMARGRGGLATAAPPTPAGGVVRARVNAGGDAAPGGRGGGPGAGSAPRQLEVPGVGTIDGSVIRGVYWQVFDAGEVSVNPVRVQVITLVGTSLK
jgi:hypothetical protein